jgi:subtilisin family serine protease
MRLLLLVLTSLVVAEIRKPDNGELISNEFIVVLRPNVTAADHIRLLGLVESDAAVRFTYDKVLNGYAVRMSEYSMEKLSTHPDILYVEQSQIVRPTQSCQRGSPNPPAGLWGISRVSYPDIRRPPEPVRYHGSAQAADIYLCDTGINYDHVDFGGRARFAYDATGEGPNDGNGHGSHCAGIAAGTQFGVAKTARIFDVKVLSRRSGGPGTGEVIAGLNFVAGQTGRRVASLSLGFGFSAALNTAVTNLVANSPDVLAIVASGNSNANACNLSPAGAARAITVNSLNQDDRRSAFSNWGSCTHIFAPGEQILSAWLGSTTATSTITVGTSTAAPHVTGVVADLWGRYPQETNEQIRARLHANAIRDRIPNPGTDTPNLIAQTECTAQQHAAQLGQH